jgi:hypothetical protein
VYLGDDYLKENWKNSNLLFGTECIASRNEIENADMTLLFGGLFL